MSRALLTAPSRFEVMQKNPRCRTSCTALALTCSNWSSGTAQALSEATARAGSMAAETAVDVGTSATVTRYIVYGHPHPSGCATGVVVTVGVGAGVPGSALAVLRDAPNCIARNAANMIPAITTAAFRRAEKDMASLLFALPEVSIRWFRTRHLRFWLLFPVAVRRRQ